jgi:hypothetical protein
MRLCLKQGLEAVVRVARVLEEKNSYLVEGLMAVMVGRAATLFLELIPILTL